LLKPMSQVAGVLAVQYGAQYLQKKYAGRGVTLGRIDNTEPAKVVVIGGGVVGSASTLTAAGLGCDVIVIERKGAWFKKLPKFFSKKIGVLAKNIKIIESTPANISKAVADADLVVGSVLVKGAKAPRLVTESMVRGMKKGAVLVDVAIDQGGCLWGSKPTSHSSPIYLLQEKVYCNITNMPGQVPRQSSQALTHSTFPYLLSLVNKGLEKSFKKDKGLAKGVNVRNGKVTYKAVAEALKLLDHYEEMKI
ncbi:alanine dehydrogenase, partial [Thermoproteota archaeon]